jgi:hypothetical protein
MTAPGRAFWGRCLLFSVWFVESASVCISLSYYALSRSSTYRSRLYHSVVEVVGIFSRPFMWVTHPSDGTMRDVGTPAPRVILGVIHLAAPHPVLNGSSPHDLVKDTWITTQWVLFEFLAGLQQVTARHLFCEIQHMTHNLSLQGEWIHTVSSQGGRAISLNSIPPRICKSSCEWGVSNKKRPRQGMRTQLSIRGWCFRPPRLLFSTFMGTSRSPFG